MKIHILLSLISTVLFCSCQSGFYPKSTLNIPTVDTAKKHEFVVGGSFGCGDIQHNHLIAKKLVLAHSISSYTWAIFDYDISYYPKNFRSELGLGLWSKNPFLVNIGYGRRETIIVLGGWTNGNVDDIFIPNIYSCGFQKSFLLPSKYDDSQKAFLSVKIDRVFFPEINIETWARENINDTYFDFSFTSRLKLNSYLRVQMTSGVKFFWNNTFNDSPKLSGHRLADEFIYVRAHLVF
ncbi:MAG: hypothetical protein ACPGLV_04280 [Bacteroidia bacterium]